MRPSRRDDADATATILEKRARAMRPLPAAEELRCVAAWREHRDEKARTMLVESNLRFVFMVAHRLKNLGVSKDDLVASGAMGLARAVDKFDPGRGAKFLTCANHWIRMEMMELIITGSGLGHSRGSKAGRMFFKLRREKRRIDESDDRAGEMARYAKSLKLTVEELERLFAEVTGTVASLDAPLWEDGEATRLDYLADGESLQDDRLDQRQQAEAHGKKMDGALAILTPRERKIIERRHLVDQDECETLEALGQQFGVSRERIRQLEARAVKKIGRHVKMGMKRSPDDHGFAERHRVAWLCLVERAQLRSEPIASARRRFARIYGYQPLSEWAAA